MLGRLARSVVAPCTSRTNTSSTLSVSQATRSAAPDEKATAAPSKLIEPPLEELFGVSPASETHSRCLPARDSASVEVGRE